MSQLPEASGRQFVPPDSPPHRQQQQQQQLNKSASASPAQIELHASSGSSLAALATAQAMAHAEEAGVRAASPAVEGLPSRSETWTSPLASRMATEAEAAGQRGSSTAIDWLPDIFPVSHRSPGPGHFGAGMDGSSSGSPGDVEAGGAAAAGAAADGVAAEGPQRVLRTIRVLRPQQPWVRPLLLGILILVLVTILVVCPVVLSRSGGCQRGGGGGMQGPCRARTSAQRGETVRHAVVVRSARWHGQKPALGRESVPWRPGVLRCPHDIFLLLDWLQLRAAAAPAAAAEAVAALAAGGGGLVAWTGEVQQSASTTAGCAWLEAWVRTAQTAKPSWSGDSGVQMVGWELWGHEAERMVRRGPCCSQARCLFMQLQCSSEV